MDAVRSELGCRWLSQQNQTPDSHPDPVEGPEELSGNKSKISLELQRTVMPEKGLTESLHECAAHLQVELQASSVTMSVAVLLFSR